MTVLWRSIARVIGPTPPGTGEIQAALGSTSSKRTSPTSFFVAMYADIDDDRAFPDVLGPDHLPLSGGDDEDVSPPGNFGKVPGTRVAERDGRVLSQEQLCERLANEVRTPNDDCLATRDFYDVTFQERITPWGVHGRRLGSPTTSLPRSRG